ncbi:MAG TPA: transglutaminase family protein [Candidatus Dormibacteraeota bacterium]|nr:transglutaminase family protein [Candidatus Dormibacteraeota bacterium]
MDRTAYLVHQRFRYEYSRPITDLRHRLVITPPAQHADQRLLRRRIRITPATGVLRSDSVDEFGNTVIDVRARRVEKSISFEAWFVVSRQGPQRAQWESLPSADCRRLLEPTRLTAPDRTLREVAATLMATGDTGAVLAARITQWVYTHMTYGFGSTGVRTDAATALRLRTGVCQDYAHIMLSLSRLCGIPARYVSGHLLGEGGTHAWVEVLVPNPGDDSRCTVHAFDATHGRAAGLTYLTVALGRDYGDVAPTSGTYSTGGRGSLDSRKRVDLVHVEYAA